MVFMKLPPSLIFYIIRLRNTNVKPETTNQQMRSNSAFLPHSLLSIYSRRKNPPVRDEPGDTWLYIGNRLTDPVSD